MARNTHTDALDADTSAWLADMGEEYTDDESDFSVRYAYLSTDAPRVERVARAKPAAHVPGTRWQDTACLCTCHYASADCDDASCSAWARQNAARAAASNARKASAWERKQARSA